jgi:hypothetical protein
MSKFDIFNAEFAVFRINEDSATPPTVPALPVILIPQVPEAPVPVVDGAPISAKDHDTFPEPFTLLPVAPTVIVRAVPQFAVVMAADPLKLVPLIALVV